MSAGPLTLRQLADALGVETDTVRVLLQCRLLQPPRRRPGHRDDVAFHQEHVQRLGFIKRALGVGFHLDEIARLVDSRGLTCGDVYALATQRLNKMRRTKEDTRFLEALIRECRARSQEGLIQACPAKGGHKDCRILAKLHGLTGIADRT